MEQERVVPLSLPSDHRWEPGWHLGCGASVVAAQLCLCCVSQQGRPSISLASLQPLLFTVYFMIPPLYLNTNAVLYDSPFVCTSSFTGT